MLPIFICEDNDKQRETLVRLIENYVMMEEYAMKIVVETPNPYDVLDYLETHPVQTGIYVLDVDLKTDINGIALGSKIRKMDSTAKIFFVTTHSEMTTMIFTYKVEALDYIVKDMPDDLTNARIKECLDSAYESYLNDRNPERRVFNCRVDDKVKVIDISEIMFFTTDIIPHMVNIHLHSEHLCVPGSLKEIEIEIPEFFRSHKSYLINPNNIYEIDSALNEIKMKNGESSLVSARKKKNLLQIIGR